ncbi:MULTISPECIES: HAMP domain-containing sensor histidine kinase [Streptomyces]|uniref:Signal transduction histidine-protein kinase/phosphatase MprB n=1 Tax=Streptomyces thermoviolaceus subsp. thermoviolaceus TaxID=66860 RepID=A0ABX0YXI9_STRTL|nr:HAMP domain-containing sensor histidine kinase [Streptomyces thermoviolaceus]NJP16803.1 HAMP domain-containing histidine kinase [Streptomyces thermoviolaceus subsp. thermoviolaceus]GHB09534.1 two-component sensor histidine kinase [Streptomyces thermoviolaceus subsp. thermoviolaceus]
MRWALVKVCLAVTTMVVVAFAVPLGLVVKEMARERAFAGAERQAAAVAPALSITTDRDQLERVVASAGSASRIAVHLPETDGRPASRIGRMRAADADIAAVRRVGRASTAEVPGGYAFLQPVALGSGAIAVVEVHIPEDETTNGVGTAWAVLAGVGAALVVGSVAVADRLGVRMVQPARRLAQGAQELGEGKLGVRVAEEGPPELRRASVAFNSMADRVVQLLAAERELAADLSHRLRTPLTVLRLNAASLGDGAAAEQTRAAVAQLEREVDTVIRTAREAGPRTAEVPRAGCDAAEVVRERMTFWSALAEDEGRTWRVAGVDRPARIPVARADLGAALDALLGNVFRHTPEGTAFAVDVHHGEDAVIVLVSDAGPGIPDPEAAMARGRGSGTDGSTGLGLDIVRRLAESTGGDLAIGRSVLGGTEIRVRFQREGRRPARRGERSTVRRRRRVGAR